MSVHTGTFHMWEELRAPLLPFISYGGYDMFPVGDWLNTPGKVVVRYLPVIQPDEAATRDEVRPALCLMPTMNVVTYY